MKNPRFSFSSGRHLNQSPSSWKDLPGDILHSILLRLTACIFDFSAFSGVCKSWRSAAFASKADYMSSDSRPRFRILYHGCGSFGIQGVTDQHPRWTKKYSLQATDIAGFSFGYLIILDSNPRLLDPLSGHTILLPKFPPTATRINRAILSSPPSSSPDCLVLGWDRLQYNICCCRVSGEQRHWTEDPWPYPYGFTYYSAVHDGKLFAITLSCPLLRNMNLVIMDLALRQTELVVLPYLYKLDARLAWVDARGEVWVWEQATKCAYRLNSEGSRWERMQNLGGRSLFLGFHYCLHYVSENPTAWGGKENSVYCLSSSEKIDAMERLGRTESSLVRQMESQQLAARPRKSKLTRCMESWYCEIVMWV